ncbi:hypothetical protein NQ315_005401 [Exocentrus adspersus]|uniref:Uncharacterized protein n=1 Tax=Exocentrus adspersus TaxID=1586481 RepID=A0AAV8W2M7_9CUCU|nr:hypothetical protein NQ315_005401 [Exocentrus adspersus]
MNFDIVGLTNVGHRIPAFALAFFYWWRRVKFDREYLPPLPLPRDNRRHKYSEIALDRATVLVYKHKSLNGVGTRLPARPM